MQLGLFQDVLERRCFRKCSFQWILRVHSWILSCTLMSTPTNSLRSRRRALRTASGSTARLSHSSCPGFWHSCGQWCYTPLCRQILPFLVVRFLSLSHNGLYNFSMAVRSWKSLATYRQWPRVQRHLCEPNGLFFLLNSGKCSLKNPLYFGMKLAQECFYYCNPHVVLHWPAAHEFSSIKATCTILRHKITFQGNILLAVRVNFDDDILLLQLSSNSWPS